MPCARKVDQKYDNDDSKSGASGQEYEPRSGWCIVPRHEECSMSKSGELVSEEEGEEFAIDAAFRGCGGGGGGAKGILEGDVERAFLCSSRPHGRST